MVLNKLVVLANEDKNNRCNKDREHVCFGCHKFYDDLLTKQKLQKFPCPCDLSFDIQLKEFTKSSIFAELDGDEQVLTTFSMDPVQWAEFELNWIARYYQEECLRCSSKRKAVRAGRRAGKCLSGNMKIHLSDGSAIPISELEGTQIEAISLRGGKQVPASAHVTKDLVKKSYKITFSSGREVVASFDHPFMGLWEWIEARDLKVGDRIAAQRNGVFGTERLLDEEVEMLAFAIGDGGLSNGSFKFTNKNPAIRRRMEELAKSFNCYVHWEPNKPISGSISSKSGRRKGRNLAINMLRRHGVFGKKAIEKSVPISIQKLEKRSVALFLNRLFSNDGWACIMKSGAAEIGYASASKELARGVQELLFKFGIVASFSEKNIRLNGKQFKSWQLSIRQGESIRKFASDIGILGKEEAVLRSATASKKKAPGKSCTDTLPKNIWNAVLADIKTESISSAIGSIRVRLDSAPSYEKIRNITSLLGSTKLQSAVDMDVIWDKVVSIVSMGDLQTYNVEVLEYETFDDRNFCVEGIFTHNSEMIAVDVLHKTATNANYPALIVTPFQAQADRIWESIMKLVEGSMTLKGTIVRQVRSPFFKIQFSNGSTISLFTAGVKNNNESSNIRGQDAKGIWIDEAAMLQKNDFQTIFAIMASYPEVFLWVSGTPTSAREGFWQFCTDKKLGFREFHYPSSMSPSWTQEMEEWFHAIYSDAFFRQEFNAEFCDDAEGVFPRMAVEEALVRYDMNACLPNKETVYGIGVDWNESFGVHIAIIGYRQKDKRFWLERKIIVPKSEFTQLHAMERIIELNAAWNPSFIYADAGFGSTQIEALHAFGKKHPASGLMRKLKAVEMGGKIEMKDPIYGMVKKDTKPFIVNLCIRRLEQGEIVLPESEYKKEGAETLVDQMFAFKIKRFSGEGRPIYAQTPDHTLTAWMLGIFGFWVEHTDLVGKRNAITKVGFAGPKAENDKKLADVFPFGWITFKVDGEKEKEEVEKNSRGDIIRPRVWDTFGKTGNVSDAHRGIEQLKREGENIKRAGRIGMYNYFAKQPPKRKTF